MIVAWPRGLNPVFMKQIFALFALLLLLPGWAVAAAPRSGVRMENVDLIQAVKIMGKATGVTFVFNAKDLAGKKITILSDEEFTPQEAMRIFEALLDINDLALVKEGKVVRITPLNDAKSGMAPAHDAKDLGSYVTRVITVKNINVKAAKASLAPLISKSATLSQSDEANALIIKDTRENTERLAEIVRLIDIPGGNPAGPEIYPLKYASADEMAGLLGKVFDAANANKQTLTIYADNRTNSLILIGLSDAVLMAKSLLSKLDKQTESGGNIRVFPLKSANAGEVSKVMEKFARDLQGKKTKGGNDMNISVMADVPSNSLIIFAGSSDFETLEKVIDQLDIARNQVFIQALIMEIKLDKSLDLGVEWQAGQIVNEGTTTEGLVTAGGVGSTGGPKAFPAQTTGGAQIGVVGGPITFGGQQFSSFNAFIKANQQDSEIDILSNPQILTLNNEEAEIKVGEIVPTLGTTKVDPQGNQTTTIDYKEVGVALKIVPQINSDGTIELKIEENSSNLVEGKVDALGQQGAITTLNRSLKTKVVVADGQTIALGGLISDEKTQVEQKTPCLGDIPIFGWFFKTQSAKTRKTNLMIFLTPKIVHDDAELAQVSEAAKLKLQNARKGRFRVDVSKEYRLPEVDGEQEIGIAPAEGNELDAGRD